MWETANINAIKDRTEKRCAGCWPRWYIYFTLILFFCPILFCTGGLIAYATAGILIGPIIMVMECCRRGNKCINVLIWYIPAFVLVLIGGCFGIAFGSIALVLYYLSLSLFFLRLACRSCCSFRSLRGLEKVK